MRTYAKIRRLTEQRSESKDQAFQRLAELLRGSDRVAVVRCTVLSDNERQHWTFDMQGRECQLQGGTLKVPKLELIGREATFWEIADGRLSPLDAFTQGRLRVLGDTKLATYLMKYLADGDGATSICGG